MIKIKLIKISAICLFLFACYSFSYSQTNTKEKNDVITGTSEISFENTENHYGKIKQGSDGSSIFTFVNTGDKPLILRNVTTSCGCTVPTWPKEPILPGEKGEIKVVYNTRQKGYFAKTITVISNAKTNLVILHIKGTVTE